MIWKGKPLMAPFWPGRIKDFEGRGHKTISDDLWAKAFPDSKWAKRYHDQKDDDTTQDDGVIERTTKAMTGDAASQES